MTRNKLTNPPCPASQGMRRKREGRGKKKEKKKKKVLKIFYKGSLLSHEHLDTPKLPYCLSFANQSASNQLETCGHYTIICTHVSPESKKNVIEERVTIRGSECMHNFIIFFLLLCWCYNIVDLFCGHVYAIMHGPFVIAI